LIISPRLCGFCPHNCFSPQQIHRSKSGFRALLLLWRLRFGSNFLPLSIVTGGPASLVLPSCSLFWQQVLPSPIMLGMESPHGHSIRSQMSTEWVSLPFPTFRLFAFSSSPSGTQRTVQSLSEWKTRAFSPFSLSFPRSLIYRFHDRDLSELRKAPGTFEFSPISALHLLDLVASPFEPPLPSA